MCRPGDRPLIGASKSVKPVGRPVRPPRRSCARSGRRTYRLQDQRHFTRARTVRSRAASRSASAPDGDDLVLAPGALGWKPSFTIAVPISIRLRRRAISATTGVRPRSTLTEPPSPGSTRCRAAGRVLSDRPCDSNHSPSVTASTGPVLPVQVEDRAPDQLVVPAVSSMRQVPHRASASSSFSGRTTSVAQHPPARPRPIAAACAGARPDRRGSAPARSCCVLSRHGADRTAFAIVVFAQEFEVGFQLACSPRYGPRPNKIVAGGFR